MPLRRRPPNKNGHDPGEKSWPQRKGVQADGVRYKSAAGSSWWDQLAAGWSLGLSSVCLFRSTGAGSRLRSFRDLPNNPNHRVSRYRRQGLTGCFFADEPRFTPVDWPRPNEECWPCVLAVLARSLPGAIHAKHRAMIEGVAAGGQARLSVQIKVRDLIAGHGQAIEPQQLVAGR